MFILKKNKIKVFSQYEDPIRSELFSATQLEKHADSIAKIHRVSPKSKKGVNLSKRVALNENVLVDSYKSIPLLNG